MPDDPCIIWEGARAGRGYGHHWSSEEGRMVYAHRTAYEAFYGPIPAGLHIDHLCLNKLCYNPLHLEAVTNAENHRRRVALIVTCPAGHPYNPENTRINAYDGARQCRTCDRNRARERRAA